MALWYGAAVDYTDWLWLKLIGMIVLAFCWGFWRELTGRPLQRERRDRASGEGR